jgi:hypothetical protein
MKLAAAALIGMISGPVMAQTTAPTNPLKPSAAAPATPAPPSAARSNAAGAKPSKAERSAKSIDCSKQADAKTLHGKERKKFRATCMRG